MNFTDLVTPLAMQVPEGQEKHLGFLDLALGLIMNRFSSDTNARDCG